MKDAKKGSCECADASLRNNNGQSEFIQKKSQDLKQQTTERVHMASCAKTPPNGISGAVILLERFTIIDSAFVARDRHFRPDYAGADESRSLFPAPFGKDGDHSLCICLYSRIYLKPATEWAKSSNGFLTALQVDGDRKGKESVICSRKAIRLIGTIIHPSRKEA